MTIDDFNRKNISIRRASREIALSLLFSYSCLNIKPEEIVKFFTDSFSPVNDEENLMGIDENIYLKAWPMALELFMGVCNEKKFLDQKISKTSINWSLERMSLIDLNLIRLAFYEIIFRSDIPNKASLNEAIEIAKQYGDSNSSDFVNGILDKLLKENNED